MLLLYAHPAEHWRLGTVLDMFYNERCGLKMKKSVEGTTRLDLQNMGLRKKMRERKKKQKRNQESEKERKKARKKERKKVRKKARKQARKNESAIGTADSAMSSLSAMKSLSFLGF